MADFRKWFYALAVVALLAGFTIPVSAQAPPFQCVANAGVPPIVRAEGYTELVGDLTLNCNGGVPTPAGLTVPPVNVTILLSTNITSKLLTSSGFNEALLIIDEPNSAVQPTRPILNCGASGAPDTGISGPGVCAITSIGQPANTYDGTKQGTFAGGVATTCGAGGGAPATDTYGCGRPNVFQGRLGTQQNPGQFNSTVFLGVPLDPPGTTTNRTIRITNVRANAVAVGVSNTFTTANITMNISINGNTSIAINNPQQLVAYVQRGLVTSVSGFFSYLQCNSVNPGIFGAAGGVLGSTSGFTTNSPLGIRFSEGFASSFKVKNIAQEIDTSPGGAGNGVLQPGNSYWSWAGTTNYPTDANQNVPGAIYNTESGFEFYSATANPNPNPPNGIGTTKATANVNVFSNNYSGVGFNNGSTNIVGAGVASQGTRLALNFSSLPNGSQVFVPQIAFLYRQGTHGASFPAGFNAGVKTGVAVLTNTDANGAGAYGPPSGVLNAANYVAVGSSNLAVYEVLWSDPFSLEDLDVPIALSYVANLAQNLPAPGVTAQLAGGFAPFYTTAAAGQPSSTLPIPRFTPGTVPTNLYLIVKCACNLLFPYVVSTAGYDTGIAIANTSTDPGATFGFSATPQSGGIQFWYYGVGANNSAPPSTQCTNKSSPGTCPSPSDSFIPSGQVMTYVASTGSQQWGLDNRAAGFVGYVITQASFQYCHAFAYVSALGAGPTTPGTSEGYLGLLLDNTGLASGLQRTTQAGENLVH